MEEEEEAPAAEATPQPQFGEKQVAQMTAEKDDLLVNIEAGEGANMALTQLKLENEGLPEKLQSATKESKRFSEEMTSKVDSLRAMLAESQKAASQAKDKISRLEETAAERSSRLELMQKAIDKLVADQRSKVG